MILKIAGRNKQGRLVAKELSGITFVTMGTNPEGKPALEYGSLDGFIHQEDVEGVLWEVCEDNENGERIAAEKKSVLTRKSRTEEKLEENIRSMDEKLKRQNASNTDEPDDKSWEKTDDVDMEM